MILMLDLQPAKWIWLPSQRTLANTFVLFRQTLSLHQPPKAAVGWIAADSRYRLTVNGQRVQWGPAPHDPRFAEADPVDITSLLHSGDNVIGVEVLHYGHGEGTWPFGRPGLLFSLDVDGEKLVSNREWRCAVDRAHRPGQYKRWYLRALQEEFDARLHPVGWDQVGFDAAQWLPAQELNAFPSRAAYSGSYQNYSQDDRMPHPDESRLEKRSIAMMRESFVAAKLETTEKIEWKRDPLDWFEFRTPGSYLPVTPDSKRTADVFTYTLPKEVVGFPSFTIEATAGTVVELMVHENYDGSRDKLMDSHFFAWSRFICRDGVNQFETFDYEAGRWLQLHVRENTAPVKITEVGVRRRAMDWPHQPEVQVSDPSLQKLFDANLNMLENSAQDLVVDGMARERQQYSGDAGHQLTVVRNAFGETRQSARFLRTYAHGQLTDGVFSDSWPCYDRTQRLWQRSFGASEWGPIVDHSIGFCFDHYHYWMDTGDETPVRENWSKLLRFVDYMDTIMGPDGLLRVDDLGMNTVWIDHDAFVNGGQKSKKCAFNLYAVGMFQNALLPMARAMNLPGADKLEEKGRRLAQATEKAFWDPYNLLFTHVGPKSAGGPGQTDDRTLAMSILYRLIPGRDYKASLDLLESPGEAVGQSYPANQFWNVMGLLEGGRIQPVLDDLRERWATMASVRDNLTIQEHWDIRPNSTSLMSHCAVAPLVAVYQGLLGLRPTEPGYRAATLRPLLGDLKQVEITAYVPRGAFHMEADEKQIKLSIPSDVPTELIGSGGQTRSLAPGTTHTINRREL
jgi:hypothetical protein